MREEVTKSGQMGLDILESGTETRLMDLESFITLMAISMKVSGKTIKLMAEGSIFMQMGLSTKEIG